MLHGLRKAGLNAWRGAVLLATVATLVPTARALADGETITVTIGSDQTIREVAEKYLSDPDLWPEILKSSGIQSVADLHPGMELTIPVQLRGMTGSARAGIGRRSTAGAACSGSGTSCSTDAARAAWKPSVSPGSAASNEASCTAAAG